MGTSNLQGTPKIGGNQCSPYCTGNSEQLSSHMRTAAAAELLRQIDSEMDFMCAGSSGSGLAGLGSGGSG